MEMITLFNKPIPKQERGELESELKAQKWLRYQIDKLRGKLYIQDAKMKPSWIRDNKIELCDIYIKNLDAMIAEIEHYIPTRRWRDTTKRYRTYHANEYKRQAMRAEMEKVHAAQYVENKGRDGVNLMWDKEKFLLIAKDRGYRTDEGIIYAVQNELKLTREQSKLMIEKGKFTWGQVMCLGAAFQMTPKEFCDTFLAGYFVEDYGEYRASYANIDRRFLTARSIYPTEADTAKAD